MLLIAVGGIRRLRFDPHSVHSEGTRQTRKQELSAVPANRLWIQVPTEPGNTWILLSLLEAKCVYIQRVEINPSSCKGGNQQTCSLLPWKTLGESEEGKRAVSRWELTGLKGEPQG